MREKYFQQPSVMTAQQHFSQVPSADIQRSRFNRSHAYKTTFNAGELIPVFLDEIVPGDTFTLNSTCFARLATPLRPIMDNIYLDIQYFFVPNRLVWDQWPEFMGERKRPSDNPNDITMPTMPWVPPEVDLPSNSQTIGRYFGLPFTRPEGADEPAQISCLPFRAYRLIWNEWYRDQNLQDPVGLSTGAYDVFDDQDLAPLPRGKRHDYFTSALPWPQKGDPVTIPVTGDPGVYGFSPDNPFSAMFAFVDPAGNPTPVRLSGDNAPTGNVTYAVTGDTEPFLESQRLGVDPRVPMGYADMSEVAAVTINQLRTAFQVQKLLERDARGGTRYIELILSHFGVKSDDARLQRPEFLGAGTTRINVNPIASMATVPDEAPQGNLAGVGTGVLRGGFQKSFTEHGWIIGIASARADLTYQNGIERMFSRTTRYDFYWPTLAHLGEQAILNKEIFYSGNNNIDNQAFGYQERYAEYRYKPSLVTGMFNSNVQTPIDQWHLAQDFNSLPFLNSQFIEENPPIDRIVAVPSEPDFMVDIWHNLSCHRPMPVYSVPGLIDHF